MEKIKEIKDSNGKFKEEQRRELKNYFLKLSKYDLAPGAIVGIATINLFIDPLASATVMELILAGGITGASLMLGINSVATGIKAITMKEEIRKRLNEEESKGKTL